MTYHLFEEKTVKSAKRHRCIWCGERIEIGQTYTREKSTYDGHFQDHKWHPECLEDARAGWAAGDDCEFVPHQAERPLKVPA